MGKAELSEKQLNLIKLSNHTYHSLAIAGS